MSKEITAKLTKYQLSCDQCGKAASISYNKPHSLHRTKKLTKPNIQKIGGRFLCTRCSRTQTKKSA